MYEIVVPGCASSAPTSVTTLITITAMPELSKVAVIVGLAEVQIHQTALAPNLDQLRSTEDVLQVLSANKSSEYFRYTRKKVRQSNPFRECNHPPLNSYLAPLQQQRIAHLFSARKTFCPPLRQHTVHCNRASRKHCVRAKACVKAA